MKKEPLISIVVITYNSSKYVLETLDSAKAQTYQNIELIVSDDCSTDNTVEICRNWIEENKGRFVRTELVTVERNTGISANCNRGFKTVKGEWIKGIAGDDILFPYAIESVVEFINDRNMDDISLVVSAIKVFKEQLDNVLYIWPTFAISEDINKQLKRVLIGSYIIAPGVFIKTETYNKVGGISLRYPMLEDTPLWINFLTNGYKFYHLNKTLVGYRIHANSISNGSEIPKKFFFDSLYNFKMEVVLPLLRERRYYFNYVVQYQRYKILNKITATQKMNSFDKLLLKILYKINRLII